MDVHVPDEFWADQWHQSHVRCSLRRRGATSSGAARLGRGVHRRGAPVRGDVGAAGPTLRVRCPCGSDARGANDQPHAPFGTFYVQRQAALVAELLALYVMKSVACEEFMAILTPKRVEQGSKSSLAKLLLNLQGSASKYFCGALGSMSFANADLAVIEKQRLDVRAGDQSEAYDRTPRVAVFEGEIVETSGRRDYGLALAARAERRIGRQRRLMGCRLTG
jgi:hypothetical protein